MFLVFFTFCEVLDHVWVVLVHLGRLTLMPPRQHGLICHLPFHTQLIPVKVLHVGMAVNWLDNVIVALYKLPQLR